MSPVLISSGLALKPSFEGVAASVLAVPSAYCAAAAAQALQ